ncbi:FtsX-like permease family protein [Stieleria bergensis]|uniref:FtsX-like permease family protein n=1 Tax=Stieleria bergensis TaxID=2528025 RepID=A0A517SNE3_9BACT|nr:FtsX-like permease family protein [Planctomycetes bacterium SV_7m_r]
MTTTNRANDASGGTKLTINRLIFAGVRYYRQTSLSVALGVAIATSVIVGALLVGDSMRGSLRDLTEQRLGKIHSVIAPGGFFSVSNSPQTLGTNADDLANLILFQQAVVESRQNSELRRTSGAQVIACDEAFWKLDTSGIVPQKMPDDQSVIVTQSVADDLGIQVGDLVTVRLPVDQAVPADSPLGKKESESEGIPRLEVIEILPDQGLARFALSPTQATPMNVFLSRSLVQEVLSRPDQANLTLSRQAINQSDLQVSLADLGLKLQRVDRRFDDQTIYRYDLVTSDRLLLPDDAVEAITKASPPESITPVLTYLANEIALVNDPDQSFPIITYSTVASVDNSARLPLDYSLDNIPADVDVPPDAIPMVINSWVAERINASAGTLLNIAYYEPEVTNGKEIERSFQAIVTDVVPIIEPKRPYFRRREAVFDQAPTRYNDPDLTPTVPGVTDQESMSDWDTPFELTRRVPTEDDKYWKDYRLTPKAFIPLAEGRRLFGSRFGNTTGLMIQATDSADQKPLIDRLSQATAEILPALGWKVQDIRQAQLQASKGTTPFDGLFLSLSFFVIFAAIMLIAMLFRLGLVSRVRQMGTLLAIGVEQKTVTAVFMREGLVVAGLGVALGTAGGVAYAFGVLAALRTFWVGAVTVPFLTFHWSATSLIMGAFAGWFIGWLTIRWSLRSLLRQSSVSLLRGRLDATASHDPQPQRRSLWLVVGCFLAAMGAAIGGAMSGGQTAAGGFVGAGMLLLIGLLAMIYRGLSRQRTGRQAGKYSLWSLARSNTTRAPLRSTLTVGLIATASFLIVAIAAFRLSPSDQGTGGFDLIASLSQPMYEDLSDPKVRSGLLGPAKDTMTDTTVVMFRQRTGQDASCNNLYRASEPTVFGVPQRYQDQLTRFRFYAAAKTLPSDDQPIRNPWELLSTPASGSAEDPIPVIIDQNTAMWSLQMIQGIGEVKAFTYDNQTIHFQVVGLLENSLLQGRLLIGEQNFEQQFADINGYRFVMIDAATEKLAAISEALESRLGDVGFDVSDAAVVLSNMMAVQNTYLRTFQSLGGLGLLLGTLGLAIAQVRNVLERRNELAVMRAIGFEQQRLAKMVVGETAALLLLGIGCGVLCAVLAVLPFAATSGMLPPVLEPVLLVLGILGFGLLAGLLAAIKVVRINMLDALRGT